MYDVLHHLELQGMNLRTTLAIDAAKHLAEREKKTVGEVISALARNGLTRGARNARGERNGIPLLPTRPGATPVTLEFVNQLRDEQP
jgi:hypothetical protein